MNIQLVDIALIVLVFTVFAFWWKGLRVREQATTLVRKRCDELDLQLLDQSVALERVSLGRQGPFGLFVSRRYSFEFSSTGDERYHGTISMAGLRLGEFSLDTHRMRG